MHTSYIARDWLKQRGWTQYLYTPSQSEEKTQDSLTDRADVSFGKLTAQTGITEAQDSKVSLVQRCRRLPLHERSKEKDVLPTGRETEPTRS